MEDREIIELFWARMETAINETAKKYGRLCNYIAANILVSREDCEECVNDTYFGLWSAIPPQRPERFSAFVSKVVRNLSLKKYEYVTAEKRNPEAVCSFDELSECVSGGDYVENELENRRIEELLNTFLWKQEEAKRRVFVRRYWYFESIACICEKTGFSESKVKSMLFHLRKDLKEYLEREGVAL